GHAEHDVGRASLLVGEEAYCPVCSGLQIEGKVDHLSVRERGRAAGRRWSVSLRTACGGGRWRHRGHDHVEELGLGRARWHRTEAQDVWLRSSIRDLPDLWSGCQ